MAHPILIEVVRGGTVESIHRGAACVVDASGKVLRAWGDADALICPRSALKPFQALPLLRSGAADAAGVTSEELALACASHSGEPMHVGRIAAWLARLGLSERDLECGAHMPGHEPTARALICENVAPSALHNNCSGKHTGFLCCAQHVGAPTKGYIAPDHPLQEAVLRAIADMTAWNTATAPIVVDGCSAPNLFLPLRNLARGWARLAEERRIIDAMKTYPLLVSGIGRPCAQLTQALASDGVVKTGAEGVYAACLPERGLGIAVKIDDGAGRGSVVAITAILKQLDAFRADADVSQLLETPIVNWRGTHTGVVRAVMGSASI
jgi:L-asparaginase II